MSRHLLLVGLLSSVLLMSLSFKALGETLVYKLVLENHTFSPDEIVIPANKKVQLLIENKDAEAEEFDSFDLNREKVIFPQRHARLFIGPLPPGQYEFFGEFHPDTARGSVLVKEEDDAH